MGRPFMAPPGLPDDRKAALRAAFDATMKDPEFVAEAKARGQEVNPVSGAALDKLLAELYATPKDVVEETKRAIGGRNAGQAQYAKSRMPDRPAFLLASDQSTEDRMGQVVTFSQLPASPVADGIASAPIKADVKEMAAELVRIAPGKRWTDIAPRGCDLYLFMLNGAAMIAAAGDERRMPTQAFATVQEGTEFTVNNATTAPASPTAAHRGSSGAHRVEAPRFPRPGLPPPAASRPAPPAPP